MAARVGQIRDSEEDIALEASLRKLKFSSSNFLDNPDDVTSYRFISASKGHISDLRAAGMPKQAGEMTKVHKDFEAAKPTKRQRIVAFVAKTLLRVTAKKLAGWTIASAVSIAGVGYALYEIEANGRLIDVSDVNLDGFIDVARIDVNYDNIADYKLSDQDGDGAFDTIAHDSVDGSSDTIAHDSVDGSSTEIASGDWVEGAIEMFGNVLDFFS